MRQIDQTLTHEIHAIRLLPTPAVRRAIREAAGVSQDRIGRELGVTRMAVSRWERGLQRPRGPLLAAYVALLRDLQWEFGVERPA